MRTAALAAQTCWTGVECNQSSGDKLHSQPIQKDRAYSSVAVAETQLWNGM